MLVVPALLSTETPVGVLASRAGGGVPAGVVVDAPACSTSAYQICGIGDAAVTSLCCPWCLRCLTQPLV